MKVNITAASDMVGITRATFYRHIEKKGISVEKDEEGNPTVDTAELIRVYGDKVQLGTKNEQPDTILNTKKTKKSDAVLIESLNKQISMLQDSSSREREILEKQIENLQDSLSVSQKTAQQITVLLEDHSKNSSSDKWEAQFKALEQRISNQEKEAKEKEERILKQNRALKTALIDERSKGFFKKLFG